MDNRLSQRTDSGLSPPVVTVPSSTRRAAHARTAGLAVGLISGILCVAAGLMWYRRHRRQRATRSEQAAEIGTRLSHSHKFGWGVTTTVEPYTKVTEAGLNSPPQVAPADSSNMHCDVIEVGFVNSRNTGEAESADQGHSPNSSHPLPKVFSKAAIVPSPPGRTAKPGSRRVPTLFNRQIDSGFRFAATPTSQAARPSTADLPPAYTDY